MSSKKKWMGHVCSDGISTSLQLGYKPRMLRASKSESLPEQSETNVDCENEMELLGFPKILTAGG